MQTKYNISRRHTVIMGFPIHQKGQFNSKNLLSIFWSINLCGQYLPTDVKQMTIRKFDKFTVFLHWEWKRDWWCHSNHSKTSWATECCMTYFSDVSRSMDSDEKMCELYVHVHLFDEVIGQFVVPFFVKWASDRWSGGLILHEDYINYYIIHKV